MKTKLVCSLCCLGCFYLGTLWNETTIQTASENNKASSESREDGRDNKSRYSVYYKLNDEILADNQLNTQIEGYYNVSVQAADGKETTLFDGQREITKIGKNYFLKVYNIPSDITIAKNEYIQLRVLEGLDVKLILSKDKEVQGMKAS